jgi:hypothetical protein
MNFAPRFVNLCVALNPNRKPTSMPDTPEHHAAINDAFAAIRNDGQGVLTLEGVFANEAQDILIRIVLGVDPGISVTLALAVSEIVQRLTAGAAPLCLLCPQTATLANAGAFLALFGSGAGKPTRAMGHIVCRACCDRLASKPAVIAAARNYYLGLYPEWREISIANTEGRA